MGEPPGSYYAADFTNVKAAMEGTCENCGTTAKLKHMHNKDRSKIGRDLCTICYQYYRNKNGTVRRSSVQTPHGQVNYSTSHQHDVHKHVAQAQRGRSSNDVQAIGGSNLEQGRPTGYIMETSSGPLTTPGPSVHLPGNIPQYTFPPPIIRAPQPVGYTQTHATYAVERHERIQQAYSTHNGEVVVVEVRMVLMLPGRVQVQLIHDLVEAVDHIPVHIGAVALKNMLYNAIIPRWNRWTNNFPIHIDQIAMRDKMWVILEPSVPDRDVIAKYFFKTGKKGAQTFKSGKTIINFHIPNEIYDTMLQKRDTDDSERNNAAGSKPGRRITAARVKEVELSMAADFTVAVDKGKKRARSPSPTSEQGYNSSDIEIMPPLKLVKSASVLHEKKRREVTHRLKSSRAVTCPTSIAPTGRSDARSATSMPTASGRRAMSKSRPSSPSAEHISEALKTQQLPTNKEMSSFFCLTTLNVVVYPVERRTWAQLLEQAAESTQISIGKEGNSFYLGTPLISTLQLDLTTPNMKNGCFKLAAFGTSMPAIFKAGRTEAICAKRTYNTLERVVEVDGSLMKKVVNVPHEGEMQFQRLTMEVRCLVWAQALLDIVYDFIKEGSEDPMMLPFFIPQFRFVEAAITIEQSSTTRASVKKTIFLLEEVIDADKEGPFRKYLNNVSPVPLAMETKEDEERANFLAFTQHVQYWKTKKQVFVSDYQGGNTLLTDPQISSAGALGPIFAGGNIPLAHHNFETKHRCNIFCKWFSVPTFMHNATGAAGASEAVTPESA